MIFLIHQSHNFVSGNKETWWSRRIHTILLASADYVTSHCCFVKFQDNLYWAIKATVCNNPQKDNLHKKIYTEDDIIKGCTKKGGWGITVELPTGEKMNILYTDLLRNPIHLQIWVSGKSTNYERIRMKIKIVSTSQHYSISTSQHYSIRIDVLSMVRLRVIINRCMNSHDERRFCGGEKHRRQLSSFNR